VPFVRTPVSGRYCSTSSDLVASAAFPCPEGDPHLVGLEGISDVDIQIGAPGPGHEEASVELGGGTVRTGFEGHCRIAENSLIEAVLGPLGRVLEEG